MAERKTLTITQVSQIQRFGADNQGQKLPFKAKDGDAELDYIIFKRNLFDKIKQGEIINADIETEQRGQYTNRKIIQIYVDGQPVGGKGGSYRGKSPEELELSAKSYALSYAKDLAVAGLIPLDKIPSQADIFYQWLKGNGNEPASPVKKSQSKKETTTKEQEFEDLDKSESPTPTGKKVQNITEFKGLLMKHKIGTHEAYEILSIKSFMDLVDLDKAWADIKKAKGIE